MKNYVKFLALVPFLMAFQCNEEIILTDPLEEVGLLGRWEINEVVVNEGIAHSLPLCCEFMEFETGEDTMDDLGVLTVTAEGGVVAEGPFEVDFLSQSLLFRTDGQDTATFEFEVDASRELLTLTFTENETQVTQNWVRVD